MTTDHTQSILHHRIPIRQLVYPGLLSMNLKATTRLDQIPLPFMDVVLGERFLLPVESLQRFQMPIPQTIADIVESSGLPLENVLNIFHECLTLNQDIWLDAKIDDFVGEEQTWIIDMRPMIGFDVDPLHPDARIFHHGNQGQQLELMRTMKKVIVLSTPASHAWSAAMSLRQMKVPAFLLSTYR